ncbi:MAG: hypothetical protein WD802_11350 [Gemmatimonadaceae bacterium]
MSFELHVVHLLHAILLFFAVNWLGGHAISAGYLQLSLFARADEAPAFNIVFRVLSPLVFLILVAVFWHAIGLSELVKGIWLVAAYYVLFRWTFNIVVGRASLLNWPAQVVLAFAIVGAAFVLDAKVLQVRGNILPDPSTLGNELWIVVLLFLYQIANATRLSSTGTERRKRRYIANAYRRYRQLFGDIIEKKAPDIRTSVFIYAVLIYEAFNRPLVYRIIEQYLLYPLGVSKTTGIMQVRNATPLTDRESVARGADLLIAAYNEGLSDAVKKWRIAMILPQAGGIPPHVVFEAMYRAAGTYNIRSDYTTEIMSLYQTILTIFHPELVDHSYGQHLTQTLNEPSHSVPDQTLPDQGILQPTSEIESG